MTASQQPTGHDKPLSVKVVEAAIDRAQEVANCAFEETVAGEFCNTHHCYSNQRHETRSECNLIAGIAESAGLAAAMVVRAHDRAALAAGDPDVAEALGLSEQVRGCDHGFIHPDPDLPQVWSSNVPCPTADQRRFVTHWTEA